MSPSEESEPPNASRNPASTRRTGTPPGYTPHLINRQRTIDAAWSEIREFLNRIPPALAPSASSVCLVSDRSMRGYNRRFRGKNESTDVLSFPAGAGQLGGEEYLGDIVISIETAKRNAARISHRVEDEIKLLILHGLLHLLGMDHERDNGQMARRERRWAARLGLPLSLIGRNSYERTTAPRSAREDRASGTRIRRGSL